MTTAENVTFLHLSFGLFSHSLFDTFRTEQSAHCHLSGAIMKESVDAGKKRTIKDKGRQVINCDRATWQDI